MDKLLTETEKEALIEKENLQQLQQQKEVAEDTNFQPSPKNSYISSFADLTVADIRKEEENQKKEEAEAERLRLMEKERNQCEKFAEEEKHKSVQEEVEQETEEESVTESATIIEKPNYDLLESKVIMLKKTAQPKKKRSKKLAGLILACALGGAAIICVTNCVILDQLNSVFLQLEDSYNLNLAKYLRDINNLDATKNSMEMLETYPEALLDAGDLGQKSNWFDRLCNFIGGLFGG